MRWDQYSNVLQLAAALSLAGWVARPGHDSSFNASFNFDNPEYHSDNNYDHPNRYHPYLDNHLGPLHVSQLQQYHAYNQLQEYQQFHQSKDAEERFRSSVELQDLLSWHESYRRGELNFLESNQYNVLPVINNRDKDDEYLHEFNVNADDGYGSGGRSISSPSSSFNDIDASPSPFSERFLENIDLVNIPGASGYNEDFDIDKLLDADDSGYNAGNVAFNQLQTEPIKLPFESLERFDMDLEYVNSPLKSPTFDEFLASPNPNFDPNVNAENSFEDPFNMRFTNSSALHNKLISDVLLDLDDFDISDIKLENISSDVDDIDNSLVKSLPYNNPYSAAPLAASNKQFSRFEETVKNVMDHDYPRKSPDVFQHLFEKSKEVTNNITFPQPNNDRRTFAPSVVLPPRHRSKTKAQKSKAKLVWPDFAYTSDELINMPVDTFNEILKTLPEIRKHVAKDIRRKGKNKYAARDCRKRKMQSIENLDTGVEVLMKHQQKLLQEREKILKETSDIRKKTQWLNNYIFQHLRDHSGRLYSTSEYSLEYTSDGNVYLVPSNRSKK